MYTTTVYKNEHLVVQKPISFPIQPIKESFPKKNTILKAVGITALTGAILLDVGGLEVFADGVDELNSKMETLYFDKFIKVSMWILIGKGGWDTVHKAIKEDFEGAKKSFLQYLMVFAVLLGLPTALKTVEELFRSW